MNYLADGIDDQFSDFVERITPLLVIDHAGRAGNGFFQTIFDQHPQVIACPWMHYVYSYLISEFDSVDAYGSRKIWEFWRNSRYFSLLYRELDGDQTRLLRRFGGNPDAVIDREVVRFVFDRLLLGREVVSRKYLIAAIFFSYAKGLGRDVSKIRYIVCPDSISLRAENIDAGFTGRLVDLVMSDYPNTRLVHLERDPRAGFASTNHQFVNQSGNMYGIRPGNYISSFSNLLRGRFDWEGPFIFGFLLVYFKRTFETINRKRDQYKDCLITVRNEDLNLNFTRTMKILSELLKIDYLDTWTEDFSPTMLGLPWTGTGAYNSQYQTSIYGPLKNDPDKIARTVSGPNAYVTQRWRSRLSLTEIFILECALGAELQQFGYDRVFPENKGLNNLGLVLRFLLPFKGELPSPRWVLLGLKVGFSEFIHRLFFVFCFPVFYLFSRVSFALYCARFGVFNSK